MLEYSENILHSLKLKLNFSFAFVFLFLPSPYKYSIKTFHHLILTVFIPTKVIKDDVKLIHPLYIELVFCACYHMYKWTLTIPDNKQTQKTLSPPFFLVADSSAQPFILSFTICTINFFYLLWKAWLVCWLVILPHL